VGQPIHHLKCRRVHAIQGFGYDLRRPRGHVGQPKVMTGAAVERKVQLRLRVIRRRHSAVPDIRLLRGQLQELVLRGQLLVRASFRGRPRGHAHKTKETTLSTPPNGDDPVEANPSETRRRENQIKGGSARFHREREARESALREPRGPRRPRSKGKALRALPELETQHSPQDAFVCEREKDFIWVGVLGEGGRVPEQVNQETNGSEHLIKTRPVSEHAFARVDVLLVATNDAAGCSAFIDPGHLTERPGAQRAPQEHQRGGTPRGPRGHRLPLEFDQHIVPLLGRQRFPLLPPLRDLPPEGLFIEGCALARTPPGATRPRHVTGAEPAVLAEARSRGAAESDAMAHALRGLRGAT